MIPLQEKPFLFASHNAFSFLGILNPKLIHRIMWIVLIVNEKADCSPLNSERGILNESSASSLRTSQQTRSCCTKLSVLYKSRDHGVLTKKLINMNYTPRSESCQFEVKQKGKKSINTEKWFMCFYSQTAAALCCFSGYEVH